MTSFYKDWKQIQNMNRILLSLSFLVSLARFVNFVYPLKEPALGLIFFLFFKKNPYMFFKCEHHIMKIVILVFKDIHFYTPKTLKASQLLHLVFNWINSDFFFFSLINLFFLFIYFWLCWVFIAVRGLPLVAASGGYSLLQCAGFSLWWLLSLWSMGSRRAGFSSCGMWAL